ncbi:hypothetical protein M977_04306 [Buttiauxella gaviniae ATCC 51604]|uniref:DUF2971 domain-containing protein n=1 Tax=Buttiauxella gaviniae ATCC 51604 TaxID=1354253 RepID=A0A1B7HN74_9ENTR|nr:DUF2971 domain-containing protein [Buttiauxella gaviniae]OAT17060.1 hypothetical protein M977_04306 [Buttiauxella gaviniae ATCC 51604]
MSDERPTHFYKYRSINFIDDAALSVEERLKNDYSIKNLLNNESTFSSRLVFNDLFDSKIDIIPPTPEEFEALIPLILDKVESSTEENLSFSALLQAERVEIVTGCVHNGKFTDKGIQFLESQKKTLTRQIDCYPFICFSSNKKSNLMWSHYADSHKGFCIEFKADGVQADKVEYKEFIPKMNLIDWCRLYFGLDGDENTGAYLGHYLGDLIWKALRTKLIEWQYEDEYRYQPSNDIAYPFQGNKKYCQLSYDPDCIESIILGWRMPVEIKNYIIEHMPPNTKFNQAYPGLSTIEIMDYQEWLDSKRA